MAKNLFNNEDVLKWMQYFAENTPIDLEQITMMDVTKGNANIIPMVEAHKAVLAFMEAGDKEVFYRMWNAGLGDCEVWYNEGSKPEGAIKHDSLKDMAKGSGSTYGTGGMYTKVAAAEIACHAGADLAILSSTDLNLIVRLLNGKDVGTLFVSDTSTQFDIMDYIVNKKYLES